jgi:hypothetical protein
MLGQRLAPKEAEQEEEEVTSKVSFLQDLLLELYRIEVNPMSQCF